MERVFKGRKEPPAKEWCWGPKPSSPQEETSAPLGNAGVMVTGPRGRSGVAVTVGQRAGGGKDRGGRPGSLLSVQEALVPLEAEALLEALALGVGALGGPAGRGRGRGEGRPRRGAHCARQHWPGWPEGGRPLRLRGSQFPGAGSVSNPRCRGVASCPPSQRCHQSTPSPGPQNNLPVWCPQGRRR